MKIGYDAKRAFLNTSGLGNYSRNTLNALVKYFPNHQYTLFTPEIKAAMLEEQDKFELWLRKMRIPDLRKPFGGRCNLVMKFRITNSIFFMD